MLRIRNTSQVERISPIIMQKIANMFYVHHLRFKEDGTCLIGVLAVAPSRQYSDLTIEDEIIVLTTEGWARPIKHYCADFINVTVEGPASLARLNHKIIRIGEGVNTHFLQETETMDIYRDVITGEEFKEYGYDHEQSIWHKKTNELRHGSTYIEYLSRLDEGIGAMTETNGQLKKFQSTMYASYKLKNDKEFNCMDSWRRVTYNAVDYLCTGEQVTAKKIAQGNARLSQYKSPSVPIGEVETYSVYMGKLTYADQTKVHEYRDGWAFLSAEFIAKQFNKINPEKYKFLPTACDGLGIQCRPWLNKVFGECVMRNYIKAFIAYKGWEEIVLIRGQVSEEDTENFVNAIKYGTGPFAGKLVTIVNDPERAKYKDMLTDLNGLKAPFDPNLPSMLEILAMTHEEHDIDNGASTSSQLIQSLMIADPSETIELLTKLAFKYLNRKIDILMAEKGPAPRWEQLHEQYDIKQVLESMIPKFAREQYAPLWHKAVDSAMEGYISNLRRLKIPCAGAHLYLTVDPAADFGIKVLGINSVGEMEVLCPIATKRGLKRMAIVKYPKQHFQEFGKCRVITPKEYEVRLREKGLSNHKVELIMQHVQHMSKGYIVLPAIKEIANMLAGMDYDGDSVSAFFEEQILNILWLLTPKAVIIDENDKAEVDVIKEVMNV